MHRIFYDGIIAPDSLVTVSGEDAIHLSVSMRSRVGDSVEICDSEKTVFVCTVTGFTKSTVTLKSDGGRPSDEEPSVKLSLYVGLPKNDKLELIIQKATELGVAEIIPFVSERTVAKPNPDKIGRLRKIAREAAGQCARGEIPYVSEPLCFEAAMKRGLEAALPLFCHEGEGTIPLSKLILGKEMTSVSIFTGPEGGFSKNEFDKAGIMGYNLVGLGRRILRCETAPLAAAAAVMLCAGEF
ncbi:MAG: 16S rRNA (uracil(1498)-N(3))-methyltransferase [Clostridia bacterium]|nr:16S rRNA (uracil(1498)-N(3))-methyltransferase [Clostridia bacterium]